MTTKNKCRAKNPGSCRVHGSFNAVDVITNDKIAQRNLFESKSNLDRADSMEAYFEASEQHAHDQKAYDATLKGMDALERDLSQWAQKKLSSTERVDLEYRLSQARDYREKILANDPTHQETMAKYDQFVSENAVSTHSFSKANRNESLKELKDLPYRTPIAVKLKNGGVVYTHAGNGRSGLPKGRFGMMVAKSFGTLSFVRAYDDHEPDRFKHVSFDGFTSLVKVTDIKEISVLKDDAYKNGFDGLRNSHTSDTVFVGKAPHAETSRWSVQGKDYYFEIEGKNSANISNISEEGRTKYWETGETFLSPEDRPIAIREIKSSK